ncbi:MAG: hypothetical protein V3R99_05870, partial [Thermoguttaceae bacterium]
MVRDNRSMTGPFLGILACLFVLSVTASRSWDRAQASRYETAAAAPQMAEPSTLARIARPNKIDARNLNATESRHVPAAAPLKLADIPDVVAGRQGEPYDPGRFTEARPAERYADRRSIVPLLRLQPPGASTPGMPTLTRHGAPHDVVAEMPVASAPLPVEPQPVLASLPERTDPKSHAIRLPEPVFEAVDAETGTGTWSEPKTLLESMAQMAAQMASNESVASRWAVRTDRLVRDLGPAVSEGPVAARRILEQLRENLLEVDSLATAMSSPAEATRLRRIGHALRRRLDVWQQVTTIDDLASPDGAGSDAQPGGDTGQIDTGQLSLALALAEIDTLTADSAEGKAWRDYLMFDALHDWTSRREPSADQRMPRELAQLVFGRLTQTPVSVAQREFITSRPMAALRTQLQPWVAEPVSSSRLLAHLEQYEQTGLGSDARRLATDCLYLGLAEDQPQRDLAGQLQTHYRNANLRVAVTEVLMNRLIPEREPEYASVRDRVLDVAVHGKSMTSTDVAIRLLPDPRQIRLALEVKGRVATVTHSTTGPVTFYNDGDAVYTARKPLEIDLTGIRSGRAEVRVSNDVRLRRMETDFDEIPLVGSLVQEVARGQHEWNQDAARREIRAKIATQARRRIDSEVGTRFGELSERLRDRVVDPLGALALDPTIIAAQTTDQRITVRLRLAGKDQLASHTPRPRAPSGSLASLQVHESAINNLSDRLELAGNTYTLSELTQHIASRLNRPPFWTPDPATENVAITFAEQDPITIRLQQGRIDIALSIAKLSSGSRHWKDFQVRAFYRPEVDGRSITLVRDGVVQLVGKRLSMGSRIAVRGIFAKTFSKNR